MSRVIVCALALFACDPAPVSGIEDPGPLSPSTAVDSPGDPSVEPSATVESTESSEGESSAESEETAESDSVEPSEDDPSEDTDSGDGDDEGDGDGGGETSSGDDETSADPSETDSDGDSTGGDGDGDTSGDECDQDAVDACQADATAAEQVAIGECRADPLTKYACDIIACQERARAGTLEAGAGCWREHCSDATGDHNAEASECLAEAWHASGDCVEAAPDVSQYECDQPAVDACWAVRDEATVAC